MSKAKTFQDVILKLQNYWAEQGCVILQPAGVEVGAGTLNKHTFLRVLDEKPWRTAYVEPSRRPADGRYGENPNRLQHFYQFQVIIKPIPENMQDLYLDSLRVLGIDPEAFDVRFVEDDWEHPGLGAAGLGWEVWSQGMEVTQYTYFQQCGGFDLKVPSCELTYGLERLAMYLQNVDNVYDLIWTILPSGQKITYGDIHKQDEYQWSHYNFNLADVDMLKRHFEDFKEQALFLLEKKMALPAYDNALKCSHIFNVLDARGAVSVADRVVYIGVVRKLSRECAQVYVETNENATNIAKERN